MNGDLAVGIPAYAESQWLPQTIADLKQQSDLDFSVWVTVNNAAEDLTDPQRESVVADNRATLSWLARQSTPFPLHVIDATTSATAPPRQKAGVGWSRKTTFDAAFASGADLCVSLDADTRVPTHYIHHVKQAFRDHPNAIGLAAPYCHRIDLQQPHARQALRYEIYMRLYQLGLWKIGSPYAFLPLGSAMAFNQVGYRRARGIPLRQAAEDFYFMQNLRKEGPVIRWIDTAVEPAGRVSERVPFGTGVAISYSCAAQQRQFPFYSPDSFALLGETFNQFNELYNDDVDLAIGPFIERVGGLSAFARMRNNASTPHQFIRFCHQKFDALKTLQFLRSQQPPDASDHASLCAWSHWLAADLPDVDPQTSDLEAVNDLRQGLRLLESHQQRDFMARWDPQRRW